MTTEATPTPRWPRIVGITVAVGVTLGLLAVLVAGVAFWRIYDRAFIPTADALAIEDPTVVLDAEGDEITTLQPAAVRRNVDLDDLPDHVWQAVIAAEDRRFFEHRGVSPRGIVRAAWANLTTGERVQGASTIHQQYVAYAIEDIDDTYLGKFREAATAVRLDREMSKPQVLEQYLNSVPFGRDTSGIEAAARTYFDVSADELDVEQAAVLAGIIAAPTAFDPERNPDGAAARRDFVVDGMVEIGALARSEAAELIGSELPELREAPLFTHDDNAYFVDAVRAALPDALEEHDVETAQGLRIHTTLDQRAQALAVETLDEHLQETEHTGAIVTVDPSSGAVQALVGGRDFASQQYNVAIERSSLRSPGSAFKTFALAAMLDRGYDPDLTVLPAPAQMTFTFDDGRDDYPVRNFGDVGASRVDVREATVRSLNTAYVQLAEELGFEAVTDMADQLGVATELDGVPSAVLGSQGVTPLEMAVAYGTLANEGVHHTPHVIERVETHDGDVLFEFEEDEERVLDPAAASVVTDVLVDVVTHGTGNGAALARPVAGKTGTTNDSIDAWFVGYTPEQSTAIWVGNLDNSPMGDVTGGALPAPMWGSYVGQLLDGTEPTPFPAPVREGLRELWALRPPEPEPEPSDDAETEAEEGEDDGDEDDEDDEPEDGDEDDEPEEPTEGDDEGDGDGNGNGNGDDDDGNGDGDGNGDDGNDGNGDNGNGGDGNDGGDGDGDGGGSESASTDGSEGDDGGSDDEAADDDDSDGDGGDNGAG